MGVAEVPRRAGNSSRGWVYWVAITVCFFVAVFTFFPFPSLRNSTISNQATLHQPILPAEPLQNQTAEELLTDSLLMLKNLLNKLAEQHEPTKSLSTRDDKTHFDTRDLISSFTGLFSGFGLGSRSNDTGLAGAAKYLGVGIGNGTITGAGIPPSFLKANNINPPASGLINTAAANLGAGLASQVVGSVNGSAIFPSSADGFNSAFRSFAQGTGSGAAAGLGLKAMDLNAFNQTGTSGIAGNFGQGLSSSFLSGVNVQKMLSSGTGGVTGAQMNAAALAAAQGLGSGAAFALKLTSTPPTNASFNNDGLNGIAGNVGQGLSTSFLQNLNIQELTSGATSMFSNINVLEAAQGLGSGLGEGSVVGLGFQPASAMAALAVPGTGNATNPSIGPIVETFSKGLSQSFLQNGTAFKVLALVGGNTTLKFNKQQVAQGLGIGLVDGVSTSIENAGGVSAILSMSPQQMMGMMALPTTTTFDDSVGGAAVGMGNGLGFEAAKALLQAFGKPVLAANSTPATSNGTSASTNGVFPRSIGHYKRSRIILHSRQEMPATSSSTPAMLDTMMSSIALNPLLQTGSDTLGCQGIGGLAAVFVSLSNSKAFSGGKLTSITSAFGSLTNQTYTTRDHSGNTFTINIDKALLTTNGNSLNKEFSLITTHLGFASVAYVMIIPTLLMLNSFRNVAHLTGRTHLFPQTARVQWALALLLLLPAMGATLAFGALAEGNRNHFYSPHGILGLILLILTVIAFPLAYARQVPGQFQRGAILAFNGVLGLILVLTVVELLTGFVDLSTISSCLFQFLPQVLFVGSGFLFAIPIFSATTMMSIEMVLQECLSTGFLRMGTLTEERDGEKGYVTKNLISRPVKVKEAEGSIGTL